ncbi:MAG: aminoglycoside phosphotransferase family protein [Nanoarchaeota archaeon]
MDRYTYKQAYELAVRLLPQGFAQIERGRNNWVFEYAERVLTIPRHERVRDYSVRVNAMRFLLNRGIPVSEVLDYSLERNGTPEYLIVKKIAGGHVQLLSSTLSEREMIHQSAGEILREIHNLNSLMYGRLNRDLVGEDRSWSDFIDNFFAESLRRVKLSHQLYQRFGASLEEEYQKGRDSLPTLSPPSFLHADFHLGNLLFKNGRVSAVLDLDIVSSGDPSWDTGHYCRTFNFDRIRGVEDFRKGYGKTGDLIKERLYCLIIWARKIGTQAVQRPEALNETIPELERIFKGEI